MGMPEVYLEHRRGAKPRRLRVTPNRDLFVIGSSKDADFRIVGEGVRGCHVALRFRSPHWYVCDLSGGLEVEHAMRVNGQPITEARLEKEAFVEIGAHRIQLFMKERDAEIFKDGSESNGQAVHQVVIRARGRVVETRLLKADQTFEYHDGEELRSFAAPKDGRWIKTEIGSCLIQQRLVGAQDKLELESLEFDRELRKPLLLAFVVSVLMLGAMIALAPSADIKPEVALDRKSMEIIFNAKAVQKKRVESQKIVKVAKAKAGGTNSDVAAASATSTLPDVSQAPRPGKSPRALTSLRQSGIANLVGKIAKRANKQGVLVAAVGVSPDEVNSGRAFYSTGSRTGGGGGEAVNAGETFRLGGIATRGRAGGTGNFKTGTSLAGGRVGSGEIVAPADEETVIEGGLDREAIAEVIRRNLGQIRYCYERQLSSEPELYGKVLVKFSIGASGEVLAQRVDSSTLKSAMVEGCILRRMAGWKFPEPKGGTQVNVSYPFLFKAN